ncbi:hypothetical protein BV25DRAFT_1825447 [Artomyces pyxidatus]|uniref:Uncharacterized protein n=1 Tax=Artomyces pyxidatus TaxID=48021 RepID=A0ACB8T1V4_9AGAM|nr:hypothetical protein BV25DRAFT_1825447 [Artomyces pyxidatus]
MTLLVRFTSGIPRRVGSTSNTMKRSEDNAGKSGEGLLQFVPGVPSPASSSPSSPPTTHSVLPLSHTTASATSSRSPLSPSCALLVSHRQPRIVRPCSRGDPRVGARVPGLVGYTCSTLLESEEC